MTFELTVDENRMVCAWVADGTPTNCDRSNLVFATVRSWFFTVLTNIIDRRASLVSNLLEEGKMPSSWYSVTSSESLSLTVAGVWNLPVEATFTPRVHLTRQVEDALRPLTESTVMSNWLHEIVVEV